MRTTRHDLLLALTGTVALVAAVAVWAYWDRLPGASMLTHEAIQGWIAQAGFWGPVLVVALMAAAIVASPLPSAPIAMEAGAAYGQTLGTMPVATGAELGALAAFLIARALGHDALRKRFGDRIDIGLLGSQNALMLTVFATRLLPFVSFDMVSYAAGLTVLNPWRFALATLAGILPASFVLAYLGSSITGPDATGAVVAVLALGLVTGAPLIWIGWRRKG
jgi:uncharacterized membrane protein YdjX (TVP38/TMEM64 family)